MPEKQFAYCGYDCKKCPVHQATINNDLEQLRKILFNNNSNETVETLGCKGCTENNNINKMCASCQIRKCALDKKMISCGLCDNFPCDKLIYISDETMENLKNIYSIYNKKG